MIEAQDVIHSFWVPQFRLKQDALPGQPAELRFVATREGTYPVVCAELCGAYHGAMRTQVIVHSLEDYGAWVNSRLAQAPGAGATLATAPAQAQGSYLDRLATHLDVSPPAIADLRPA